VELNPEKIRMGKSYSVRGALGGLVVTGKEGVSMPRGGIMEEIHNVPKGRNIAFKKGNMILGEWTPPIMRTESTNFWGEGAYAVLEGDLKKYS